MKKNTTGKKIGLVCLLLFGTVMLVLICTLAFQVFFGGTIQDNVLSKNLSEFMTLYGNNQSERDLPKGLALVESRCKIADDGKTYAYTLTLKNTSESDNSLALQLYYGEQYIAEYGSKINNPLVKLTEDTNTVLLAGESKTFTVTGVILTKGDSPAVLFQEKFGTVALEILYSKQMRRIMVPVKFT
ncbi:MAG: hypothetical protein RSC76_01430 [Oscillospiraceae bacterium]